MARRPWPKARIRKRSGEGARNSSPRHLALLLSLVGAIHLPLPGHAQIPWTRPQPVHGLTGAGDILAGATGGGVVLWDLSGGRNRWITVAHGLPSHVVLAASMPPDRDALDVATANGMARGWFDGPWRSIGARNDEAGWSAYASLSLRGGLCFAGGDAGQLLRWDRTRVDSLRIPSPRGRVVSLALFTSWLEVLSPRSGAEVVQHTGEPRFPVGLVAAVDNDGVWLLRSSGSLVRWLRFVQEDGLPSHRARCVLTDSRGRLWVGTNAGIAWIDAHLNVHSLASQPLGAQRTHVLLEGHDGFLYAGTDSGLLRLDLGDLDVPIEAVPTQLAPIVAMGRTRDALWISDGWNIANLAGDRLDLPLGLSDNFCLSLLENRSTLWVGHPAGWISMKGAAGWSHLGSDHGLPHDDITHFLAVGETLFAGTAASGLYATRIPSASTNRPPRRWQKASPSSPTFVAVPGTPASVSAQVVAAGSHWIGGKQGLFVRRGSDWESFPLWQGATEVVDLCAAGDTLWVAAARGGVGFHRGHGWIVPPRPPGFGFASCGRLRRHADGRIAVATDRGLLLWNGSALLCDPQSPDLDLTSVAWWGDCVACGSHRGLWLRRALGLWDTLGVFDGLPGTRIRALQVDDAGRLWVASTRGVGRLDASLCTGATRPAWHLLPAASLRTPITVPDPGPTRLHLEVFDVRGRIVHRFGSRADMEQFIDTPTSRSEILPVGIYFVRKGQGKRNSWRRIVVLR